MFEQGASGSNESEHTDTLKVLGVPLDVYWHIDIDSPSVDHVYVADGSGDDIQLILSQPTLCEIVAFLNKRMDAMKREAKAWRGQFNNV